jgi:hypothetical protein
MKHTIAPLFCIMMLAGVLTAQEDYRSVPGYIAIEELPLFQENESSLELQIGESVIGVVARNAEKENPEFARILRKVRQIRSYSFDLSNAPRERIDQYYDQLNTSLLAAQWGIAYRMREPEATANIYTKSHEGEIAGMTIFSLDANNQFNVVNIVGNISLEDISEIAMQFGFPEIAP